MADPASLMIAASVGTAVVGGILEAQGEATAAEANVQAHEFNAKQAKKNADLTLEQAKEEEQKLRIFSRKQLGSMRAAYGASGVTVEGSALDVLEESAATAEKDALSIRHMGKLKAGQFYSEAKYETQAADAARKSGRLRVAASIIKTGGSVAGKIAGG